MTRSHRVAAVAALTLCAPLVLGACSSDKKVDTASDSSSSTTTTNPTDAVNTGPEVEVVEFSFTPSDETVKVGDTVTWKNDGNSKHTVTSTEGSPATFSSPNLEPGKTFVQTFSAPGTYSYFCSIHPDRMSGTVTVS